VGDEEIERCYAEYVSRGKLMFWIFLAVVVGGLIGAFQGDIKSVFQMVGGVVGWLAIIAAGVGFIGLLLGYR